MGPQCTRVDLRVQPEGTQGTRGWGLPRLYIALGVEGGFTTYSLHHCTSKQPSGAPAETETPLARPEASFSKASARGELPLCLHQHRECGRCAPRSENGNARAHWRGLSPGLGLASWGRGPSISKPPVCLQLQQGTSQLCATRCERQCSGAPPGPGAGFLGHSMGSWPLATGPALLMPDPILHPPAISTTHAERHNVYCHAHQPLLCPG